MHKGPAIVRLFPRFAVRVFLIVLAVVFSLLATVVAGGASVNAVEALAEPDSTSSAETLASAPPRCLMAQPSPSLLPSDAVTATLDASPEESLTATPESTVVPSASRSPFATTTPSGGPSQSSAASQSAAVDVAVNPSLARSLNEGSSDAGVSASPSAAAQTTPAPSPSDSSSVEDPSGTATEAEPAATSDPAEEAAPLTPDSDEVAGVEQCPPMIAGLTAVPGINAVNLEWMPIDSVNHSAETEENSEQPLVTDVRIVVSRVADGADAQELLLAPTEIHAIVSGLMNGVEYQAMAWAVGPRGSGPASEAVRFTPTTGVEGEVGGLLVSAPDADHTMVPGESRVDTVDLTPGGEVLEGINRLVLSESVDIARAEEIASSLEADPEVTWAEPDLVVLPASEGLSARASDAAWNFSGEFGIGTVADEKAGAGVTVAVIDTGITEHPDLSQRVVAGYDFVTDSEVLTAVRESGGNPVSFDADYTGDFGGLGRDSNPADPGDWRAVAPVRDSSWHGTQIAGVIAEAVPSARIQPIRALSWRGGLLSDVAAAVAWASGASVEGAPTNATPSQIINLSFSVQSACPRTLQAAIDTATQHGSVVVAAAGNANDDAGAYAPGNCAGVVTVGATGRDGKRASYSNFGDVVALSAPGGSLNADGGVLAASNDGATSPQAATLRAGEGTSIAAAHVSATLAAIAAEYPTDSATTWVRALTGSHLRSFAGNTCDDLMTKSCGAGIVQIATGTAFTCEPVLYQVAATTLSTSNRNFYSYSPISNNFSAFGPTVTSGNTDPQPLGYNTADNYMYAMTNYTAGTPKTMDLMRVDNTGTMTRVNTWTVPMQLNVGDFWGANRYVIGSDYSNSWGVIDVSNTNAASTQSYESFAIRKEDPLDSGQAFYGKDMAILGDTGYGLHNNILYVLNLNTAVVTTKTVTGLTGSSGGFGSAYADSLGNLYFFQNDTSYVWRIAAGNLAAASPTATQVGSGPAYVSGGGTTGLTAPNDGASCPNAESPYSASITGETETSVSATAATLSASVNPNSISTTVAFCYGTSSTPSGGALTGCTTTSSSSAFTSTSIQSRAISGLTANTTYYWQAVATSSWATTYSSIQSFTTTSAPTVITQATSPVAATTATLHGSVNPGGLVSTASFCVGTAADLTGCTTVTAAESPLAAANSASSVSAALTGLSPGTTYYARVSATNSDGTNSGGIVSFTTSAVPVVSTASATSITSAEAQLVGTVNPKALTSSVVFCFGTAADLTGCTSVVAGQSPLLAVDQALTVTADISGLSASTTYYVRITSTNADGTGTGAISSFTTAAAPLTVTTITGALPDGTVGTPYVKTLTAGGGTAPYSWQISSGNLPVGLSLSSITGQISGTPTIAGATSFVMEVTDASGASAMRTFTITTVAAPLAVTRAASAVTGKEATLHGSIDSGNAVTAVEFCLGTSASLTGCSLLPAAQSPIAAATGTSSVTLNLTGLAMGTTYYARVQAQNGTGSSQGSIISFTTSDAPTATTGTATFLRTAGTQATLNGVVAPNGVATTVTFCYGTTPTLTSCTSVSASPSSIADSASSTSVSRDITGLSPNTVYYFAVRATNSLGSTAGLTASFTTPTATAVGPSVSAVSPTSGDVAGGTSITISGTGFDTAGAGATVTVGDVSASVTSLSATTIVAVTPSHTPGVVDVIVTNPDGQAYRKSSGYTYTSSVRYALTYNGNLSNGGVVPSDSTQYAYGATATAAGAGTMTRSGYVFAGWDSAANGTGNAYSASGTFTMTADTTLYAQWTPVAIPSLSPASEDFGSWTVSNGATSAHTIILANSGAASFSINSGGITVTGTSGSDFTVSGGTCANGAAVTGSASCTISLEFDPASLGARSAVLSVATSAGTVTSALTGTGVGVFAISYNGNGFTSGAVPSGGTGYAYGATALAAGAGSMSRSGYSFAGWNTASGGTGIPFAAGATIAITEDLELFAQWNATGDPSGSSSSPSPSDAVLPKPTAEALPDTNTDSVSTTSTVLAASVFFRPNSAEITRRGRIKLESLVARIPRNQADVAIYITGVAASGKSARAKARLAGRRSAALRAYLAARGVRAKYFTAVVTKASHLPTTALQPQRSRSGKPLSTVKIRF